MGSREGDAIRQMPKLIETLTARIGALEELIREDHKYMKELLRSIKKATVRQYGKDKVEETEPVDPADVPVEGTNGGGGAGGYNGEPGGAGGTSR